MRLAYLCIHVTCNQSFTGSIFKNREPKLPVEHQQFPQLKGMTDEEAGFFMANEIKTKPIRGAFAWTKKLRKQAYIEKTPVFMSTFNFWKKHRGTSKQCLVIPSAGSQPALPRRKGPSTMVPVDAAHGGKHCLGTPRHAHAPCAYRVVGW